MITKFVRIHSKSSRYFTYHVISIFDKIYYKLFSFDKSTNENISCFSTINMDISNKLTSYENELFHKLTLKHINLNPYFLKPICYQYL